MKTIKGLATKSTVRYLLFIVLLVMTFVAGMVSKDRLASTAWAARYFTQGTIVIPVGMHQGTAVDTSAKRVWVGNPITVHGPVMVAASGGGYVCRGKL